ncbi:hypothetical protein DPMN_073131 [Dreissena polymorpha]|uniref:Uncharacterized protein n=1 Tax=Dreissena polymorpha TaxID=45954 RepID=A0A9D4BYL0_DREPO|nr:hypothetical protein DPMN_073131 [Dreissena polymorpha]
MKYCLIWTEAGRLHKATTCIVTSGKIALLFDLDRDGAFAQSNNLYRHLRASKECAGTVAIPDDLRSCRY